jgi:hypothetical protein
MNTDCLTSFTIWLSSRVSSSLLNVLKHDSAVKARAITLPAHALTGLRTKLPQTVPKRFCTIRYPGLNGITEHTELFDVKRYFHIVDGRMNCLYIGA